MAKIYKRKTLGDYFLLQIRVPLARWSGIVRASVELNIRPQEFLIRLLEGKVKMEEGNSGENHDSKR